MGFQCREQSMIFLCGLAAAVAASTAQYDGKASQYDAFRFPSPGWSVLSPILDEVKGRRVLDLGCGTGAFLENILAKGAASVDGFDVSSGMIAKAQERMDKLEAAGAAQVAKVYAQGVDSIPDESYDVVVNLQVLQNLVDEPSEAYDARQAFLKQIFRVLKPGGLAVVSTRYRRQASNSTGSTYGDMYWYADESIVPKAVHFMEHAVPADPAAEMTEAGFSGPTVTNSPDTVIRTDAYEVGHLVHDQAWRAADSFFARLDRDELDKLEAHVDKLAADGQLASYIETRDALRGGLGHVAVAVGRKPMQSEYM